MERKDLIVKNAEGMKSQAEALEAVADRNVKVLVVANPANTNALVAMKFAPSIPKENFSCLARLDHERLRGFIVEKVKATGAKVSSKDVRKFAIFGNHSTKQAPYFESATVVADGETKRVTSYFEGDERNKLIASVQNRGAAVIKAQSASSALSAASAISKHLRDWLFPQNAEEAFSMGILSNGNPYGVPEGIVFSFPCCHNPSGGISIVPGWTIDAATQKMMDESVKELREEKADAENFVGSLSVTPSAKL
jgi:malate dehydrogenase